MPDVTQLLVAIEQGDPQAADQLLPLVYDELRQLAKQKLSRESPGQTLQPTALVHEAYLRLVASPVALAPGDLGALTQPRSPQFANRAHFFAAAAEAMRRILVDNARRRKTLKHGGGMVREDIEVDSVPLPEPREDLIALDEALERLAALDTKKAELVKLRYFAGLTMEEAAEALGVSLSLAEKYWTYAKAWLYREMRGKNSDR